MTGTAIVDTKPTKLDLFFGTVVTASARRELEACLPQHVSLDRFERNLKNALMANPKLLDCPPQLVWREVAKGAALGLLLDPQLGEAAIVLVWNNASKREEPQLRTMVRGLQKLARQSGDVVLFYAHEVRDNDERKIVLGDTKKLIHEIAFGDRGKSVGYYAVVKYANGERDFEIMDLEQINAIRDRSQAWQAYRNKRISSTPWATDYDEMAKKTVMRRLLKRMPQSPDLAEALAEEDRLDLADTVELAPVRPTQTPTGAPPRPHPAQAPAPQPVGEVDPVTGDVHQPPAEDGAGPETPPEKPTDPPPAEPPKPTVAVRKVEGSRELDWHAFIQEFDQELTRTPPDEVDDLETRHKDALAQLEKQARVLHHSLTQRIRACRAAAQTQ